MDGQGIKKWEGSGHGSTPAVAEATTFAEATAVRMADKEVTAQRSFALPYFYFLIPPSSFLSVRDGAWMAGGTTGDCQLPIDN
jgi:hypothetical protein